MCLQTPLYVLSTPVAKECSAPHRINVNPEPTLSCQERLVHSAEHIIFLKSHLISDFDQCLSGQTEMFFLFFLSFEAPLKRCRLSAGLAKLEYMCASTPLRAVPVFRNSLFEHNVLTALLMVWIPIDNKTGTRLSSHVLRSHSLPDQLKQISL